MSTTFAADPYAYWRALLAGKKPPITETGYQTGFYWMRRIKNGPRIPVAIWQEREGDDTSWVVLVDGEEIVTEDGKVRVWMSCAKHGVTEQAYNDRMEKGAWADEVEAAPAGNKSNAPTDPFERLQQELASIEERAAGVGPIGIQSEADSAQNIRDLATGVSKALDDLRVAEKRPIDEQAKKIQAKYLPFIERADKVVATLRNLLTIFHNREKARREKEAAEEQARLDKAAAEENARRRAEAALLEEATGKPQEVEEVAAPKVEASKTMAGGAYGRRSGLRSKTFIVIDDYAAALEHLKDHPIVVSAVEEAAAAIVIKAKGKVPGVTKKTEHVA